MKYVIFKSGDGNEFAVLFPHFMVHSFVAKYVNHLCHRDHHLTVEPVAAGEYNPSSGACFGRSETLGLESRASQDQLIISLGGFL